MQVIYTTFTPTDRQELVLPFAGFSALREMLSEHEFAEGETGIDITLRDKHGDEHMYACRSVLDRAWRFSA